MGWDCLLCNRRDKRIDEHDLAAAGLGRLVKGIGLDGLVLLVDIPAHVSGRHASELGWGIPG